MQTKKWYQSKTIWGILITAIAFFAQTYLQADITVPANADFSQLQDIANQVKAAHGNTTLLINIILGAIGTVLAIIGRVKADSKVSLPKIGSKAAMLVGFVLIAGIASAQIKSSPFKPLPKPASTHLMLSTGLSHDLTAWRFTPMSGYNVTTKQLQAGLGYGIQWLHFVDSTQKYYTDFSINLVGWVNGTTAPTLSPPNFASFGATVGIVNQLIQVGWAYTPATPNTKGRGGLIVDLAIPLNN
jgi:hypothetical protein